MEIAKPEQDRLSRYRIERPLGAGGMGVVQLAEDTRLHRRVAIKKLRPDVAGTSAQQRIRREARLLAQLNHPNIVRLYDAFEEEDGGIALVMEYVEGTTLREWMREQGASAADRLSILVQICSGLEQAHQLGIIHRDLKPDNILINIDGAAPIAKITDFGIARSWRESSNLTSDQHIALSWGAISPEQLQGKPLDHRSDLFALGMLAYRLFCGQNPFGDNDNAYITANRIINSPPPKACKINPALPGELGRLLDRLLAKKPARRPSAAAAVAGELEAMDLTAVGSAPPAAVSTEHFYRRRRRHIGAGGIALAVGLVVAALTTLLPGEPLARDARYIAIVPPTAEAPAQSREIRILTRHVLNAVRRGLSNREGLHLVPYAESVALRGQPLRRQARALGAQQLLHPDISCGESLCTLSLELIETEDLTTTASRSLTLHPNATAGSFEQTLQQLNYLLPRNPPRDQNPHISIEEADYRRYLELEAQSFEHRSAETYEGTLDALEQLQEKAPLFLPLYELYGNLALDNRFTNLDMESGARLESFLDRAPAQIADAAELLDARLDLAFTRYDWDSVEKLLPRLKAAVTDLAHYYDMKATYHLLRGEYDRALQLTDRILASRTSTNHLMQKAIILSYAGDMRGAKPYLQQALELDDTYFDATSLLAANELDMGNIDEAIRLLESVAADKRSAMDAFNLCTAHYLNRSYREADRCFADLYAASSHDLEPLLYRAEIARQRGQPDRARQLSERALAQSRERDGWENELVQALAHAQLDQPEAAVETLLETRQRAPDDTYVNHIRAQIYTSIGDLASAEAHIRRALDLGQSPVWYRTARFAKICSQGAFAELRREYPALCADNPSP